MDDAERDEEFRWFRRELELIRAQIPPRWTQWMLGVAFTGFVAWSSWVTVAMIRLEGRLDNVAEGVTDHKILPMHMGGMNILEDLRKDMADLHADVRVLATKIDRIQD